MNPVCDTDTMSITIPCAFASFPCTNTFGVVGNGVVNVMLAFPLVSVVEEPVCIFGASDGCHRLTF